MTKGSATIKKFDGKSLNTQKDFLELNKPDKFTCLNLAFKDNDQLKTNTALQLEAAKIEFKVA
jgi:hypothetical protein